MTANTSPVFPGSITNTVIQFAPSTATTKTLVTGGSNGSILKSLNYYQSAASAYSVELKSTIGAVTITLAKFTTAATADLALNLLDPTYIKIIDPTNPVLTLKAGQTLEMTVTSVASTVSIMAEVGDL